MASGREIITLQLGQYSNYIGTHWWNIQESGFVYTGDTRSEINHDVLYREGKTPKGQVTFTPRLLLLDLNGSLHHLTKEGDLYEAVAEPNQCQTLWPQEKVEIIQSPKQEKNEFLADLDDTNMEEGNGTTTKIYNLDDTVNVWSDFLRTRYHPKSVSLIQDYHHKSETKPFDIFNYGVSEWKDKIEEDFTDRIRSFAEECDNMQGFHILVDGTDGFAGIGATAVQYLEDEYPAKGILVFPTIPSSFPDSTPVMDSIRTINLSLLFPRLAEHCSLFVPLSLGSLGWRKPGPPREFPYLQYNKSLPYHSSSILAMALDTVSLRYRLQGGMLSRMTEMCDDLGRLGRRAAAASVGIPFPMQEDAYLLDTLEKWEGPLWQSLTPNCSLDEDRIWIQSVVLRGVSQHRLRSPLREGRPYQDRNPAYTCSTVQEMLALFLSCCSYATASNVTTADFPCKIAPPFPHLFSHFVGPDGSISNVSHLDNTHIKSVPAIAGLHNSIGVGTMLETLHAEVSRLQLRRMHWFQTNGLEEDEYLGTVENLLHLRECYYEEFDV